MKTNRLLNATQFLFLLRFVYEMCLGHLHVLSFGLNWFFNLLMEHTWDMIKLHTMFGPWYCEGCIYLDVYIKPWNKTRCKLRSVKMFWHIYIYIYIYTYIYIYLWGYLFCIKPPEKHYVLNVCISLLCVKLKKWYTMADRNRIM